MAINNGWTPPVGYPERKGEYIEKYYELVLNAAPKYEIFAMHKLFDLDIKSDEYKWYGQISDEVRTALIDDGYMVYAPSSNIYLKLTQKGRERQEGTDSATSSNISYTIYGTVGQINQASHFENSPTNINTSPAPKEKEPQSILSKIWQFIVALTNNRLASKIILALLGLILTYFGVKNILD